MAHMYPPPQMVAVAGAGGAMLLTKVFFRWVGGFKEWVDGFRKDGWMGGFKSWFH